VTATKQVAVTIHGKLAKVEGGVQIPYIPPSSVSEWLENYDIQQKDGVVVLYKAVDSDFFSQHTDPNGNKTSYAPGTTPAAIDWDGGKNECGGGLHFSPCPAMALSFAPFATKFVACPVSVDNIAYHPEGNYPNKVKAPKVVLPCYEVDTQGNKK
jgi:hypothetical protein